MAKEFMEDGGLDVIHKTLACFEQTGDNYRVEAFALASALSQRGADAALQSFRTFLVWAAQHLTRLKARNLSDLSEMKALKNLNHLFLSKSLEDWVGITDALVSHFNQCDKSNLDKHYTVYHAMEILKQ